MPKRTDIKAYGSSSLPPLRGKVRMGGIGLRPIAIVDQSCHHPSRDDCARLQPTQSSGSGRGCVNDNAADSALGGKYRSAPTSSISSAFRRSWSSKWMADNIRCNLNKTTNAPNGSSKTAFASSVSGTTKCWQTRTVSCRQSRWRYRSRRAGGPPTLALPRQGGGDRGFYHTANFSESHA